MARYGIIAVSLEGDGYSTIIRPKGHSMTTKPAADTNPAPGFIVLPDVPEPEDMNNFIDLHLPGNSHYLAEHLGNPETTLIIGEAYICRVPTRDAVDLFYPDMLIAFNVDVALSQRRNGYVISDHGKPPDFVLEIASESTGRRDVTVKRDGYAALGIPEYWRFDSSGGKFHGTPLAGDELVEGEYRPIAIERIDELTFQGYSAALNLNLRWEDGALAWYDPATGQHILRSRDYRERAEGYRQRADAERQARLAAENRADTAEARIRELEAELERRSQG